MPNKGWISRSLSSPTKRFFLYHIPHQQSTCALGIQIQRLHSACQHGKQFTHPTFTKCLLCARDYAQPEKYNNEQGIVPALDFTDWSRKWAPRLTRIFYVILVTSLTHILYIQISLTPLILFFKWPSSFPYFPYLHHHLTSFHLNK